MDKYLSTIQSQIKRNSNLITELTSKFQKWNHLASIQISILNDDIKRLKDDTFAGRYIANVQDEINWYKRQSSKRKKELKALAHNQKMLKELYHNLIGSFKEKV